MAKKQFKAESKRLLDLMINSIYTHKEIFLREIISNASDAVDKLAYMALTDEKVGMQRGDFQIQVIPDKDARTLTVSDNGVGMTKEELESNLGTIARSGSLQFKEGLASEEGKEAPDVDIIGQFGVGFYSAFMVSEHVTVNSKAYGSEEAWSWQSSGADGYTITPCEKETVGTDIIMKLKEDTDEENYSRFLEPHTLEELIKKYSDYIRYPIRMELEDYREKERPADAGEDYQPEWETVKEWQTVNSMVPIWQRKKSDLTTEDYNTFYKDKFFDWQDPLTVIHTSGEGAVEYKALLYIPQKAPYDFYTRDFQKGIQLYSSGVLIMDKCADLLPDHFRFVRGVVDSEDFSLNISREVLQHTSQLKVIANNLEKKIKAELLRLLESDREKYRGFWKEFGMQLKYGVVNDYGAHKELLQDLLLFHSSAECEDTTLSEYVGRMKDDQPFIYFAQGETVEQVGRLPQAERILDKGYEILYFTDEVDEFIAQTLDAVSGKKFKSVSDEDALPQTDEDKAKSEKQAEDNKPVLDFVKETLGDRIVDARISKILKTGAVCMTTDGPVSLEMERYLNRIEGNEHIQSRRVLELNAESAPFAALKAAVESDNKELAVKYTKLLYGQALLIANLPLEDPVEYTDLVCSLMS